ncbi:MAG: hypothetical protein LUH56_06575 [Oscillospiraceae bacterium]|nr:hypothetical protein [Oscillospiraceae bacterium]
MSDSAGGYAISVFKEWLKWRKDWDSLCTRCGKCCYTRSIGSDGKVRIHYDNPCEYLDTQTNLCRVYEERFKKCNHCGKLTLYTALFNTTLPEDCPYVTTFRVWIHKQDEET